MLTLRMLFHIEVSIIYCSKDSINPIFERTMAFNIDVIMRAMASLITSITIVYSTVHSRRTSKKTSKLRVTGFCARNSSVTGEIPAQMASNAENISFDDVIMDIEACWVSELNHEHTLHRQHFKRHILDWFFIQIFVISCKKFYRFSWSCWKSCHRMYSIVGLM